MNQTIQKVKLKNGVIVILLFEFVMNNHLMMQYVS